jgi:hypothetical protein
MGRRRVLYTVEARKIVALMKIKAFAGDGAPSSRYQVRYELSPATIVVTSLDRHQGDERNRLWETDGEFRRKT